MSDGAYRDADGCVCVFAVNEKKSMEGLENFFARIEKSKETTDVPIAIISLSLMLFTRFQSWSVAISATRTSTRQRGKSRPTWQITF